MAKKARVIFVGTQGVGSLWKARSGTKRYLVSCDGLDKGEPVELQHPWRAFTPEEANARVIADNRVGLKEIKNCKAVEIPRSYKP
jgi:hypothetical protein